MKNDVQITGNVEKYKIRFDLLVEASSVALFLLKGLNLWMRVDGPPAVFAKCLPYFYQNENENNSFKNMLYGQLFIF